MLLYKKMLLMSFGTTLVYWNILTMHGPTNVKFPNNTSKWQMAFNSAFKGLKNSGAITFCPFTKDFLNKHLQ
jgi:hypothetical protein